MDFLQLGVIASAAASSGPETQTVANADSLPGAQQTTDISGLWVRKGSPRGGQWRELLGQGHPELPWVGWGWLSHSAPNLGHGQRTHPSGGTAGPPHGAAAALQSSWAAKPARKASVTEVLHISPCCSQFEFTVWVSPRAAALFWGQQRQRQRQGCASGSSGLGRWVWGAHLQSRGVSHAKTRPWREPGVGECRRLWPSWELQKLFCPEVGSSSSLLPFPCKSICCPAHSPSPFPAAFQAMEMFDVVPPSTAPFGWIFCGLISLPWLPGGDLGFVVPFHTGKPKYCVSKLPRRVFPMSSWEKEPFFAAPSPRLCELALSCFNNQ